MTTEMAAPAPAGAWNKRCFIWGVGLLFGAAAAVIGFIMLAGPVLARIRHTWIRWIANTAALLLVLGAILVWLFMLLMFILMAAMSTHVKVESPGGSNVIVEQNEFHPESYVCLPREISLCLHPGSSHNDGIR